MLPADFFLLFLSDGNILNTNLLSKGTACSKALGWLLH
uniref:Uncharacterized protein n=1 Tax=Populus trichocarpa TaxID=3694 RepID=A0A3N7EZD8_POPTR